MRGQFGEGVVWREGVTPGWGDAWRKCGQRGHHEATKARRGRQDAGAFPGATAFAALRAERNERHCLCPDQEASRSFVSE
jgi:hypothetical protein